MNRLLTALACLLFSAAPLAADEIVLYDVEVIVFANRDVPAGAAAWERQMLVPDLSNAVSVAPQPEAAAAGVAPELPADGDPLPHEAFEPLTEGLRLQAEADTIRRSSRYELLAHQAWRQPGLSREARIGVHFRNGEPIPVYIELPSAADEALPMNGESGVFPATDVPPFYSESDFRQGTTARLNGTIEIGLGRYLHAYTDLIYSEPVAVQSGSTISATDALFQQRLPGWQSYRVQDHRRMRSRQLHHLDHPKLGVLILITPYEPEEAVVE